MDDVIKSKIQMDNDGVMYHETSQPSEDTILERNKELRKNPGVIQDLGSRSEGGVWGRQVASIPYIVLEKAVRDGYDIYCKDQDIAQKELWRFLRSEEGKKCMIQGKT